MTANKATAALLGVAVGDAIGVPYEFKQRSQMEASPAVTMTGYGTYYLPPGIWSDDSSLTFCLAESLVNGFDLAAIAARFVRWKEEAYWTACGEVFDIGVTTSQSISKLDELIVTRNTHLLPTLRTAATEWHCGNGSLMRILPLVFYLYNRPLAEQFELTWQVSALTHYHIRPAIACFVQLRIAEHLLRGLSKTEAYHAACRDTVALWNELDVAVAERDHFRRVIGADIAACERSAIASGGYVIESLEASLWCFLNHNDYSSTVLAAVNLGEDTDTTAAIVGGLAGLYYGVEGIPASWREGLARRNHIEALGRELWNNYAVKR